MNNSDATGLGRLRQRFIAPPREFGPTPFFALNDDLDPERVRAALSLLHDRGAAGVFLHPRTGMTVPYLSEEFWARIGAAIEHCAAIGLKAWLYDDFNWPSGSAGMILLKQRPDLRMRGLEYLTPVIKPGAELVLPGPAVAAFDLGANGRDLRASLDGNRFRAPADLHGKPVIFYEADMNDRTFAAHTTPWSPGLDGCLDYLNPDGAAAFIALTHDEYARRFSAHFGQTIPGIFTDEPQLYRAFPWTGRLAAEFKSRRGYDLVERLYLLVTERGDWRRFRCDYYSLVEELYTEGFFAPLRRWCDNHGLIFTGHLGQEEMIARHSVNHGGVFRPLRALSMPGIDALGAGEPVNGGLFNMECPSFGPRAAQAAARANGTTRVLCEAGGGSGWEASPARLKRQHDWLFASGVNFINPHQSLLSIKGLRKRDFPVSHFKQEPWFEHYRVHADYVARLSALLSEGEPATEAAVIFPTATVRADERGRGNGRGSFDFYFESVLAFLAGNQREFELVFEEEAAEGLAVAQGDRFVISGRAVPLVVLPPCHTLARAMAVEIAKFLDAGGRALCFDTLPGRDERDESLDGLLLPAVRRAIAAGRAAQVPATTGTSSDTLGSALDAVLPPDLRMADPTSGLLTHRRRLPGIDVCFIANLEQRPLEMDLSFARPRAFLEIWDPTEALARPWSWEKQNDGRGLVRLDLQPGESVALVWSEEQPAEIAGPADLEPEPTADKATDTAAPEAAGETAPPAKIPPPPLPLVFLPEWELLPEGQNALLLEPWRVKTAAPPLPPPSSYENDIHLPPRARRIIGAGRAIYRALAPFGLERLRVSTTRFVEVVEMEKPSAVIQRVTGIDLDRFGIYEGIDALTRLGESVGLYPLTQGFPAPGAAWDATTRFTLDFIPDDLTLVYEDLGEPVRLWLNGCELTGERLTGVGWDDACRGVAVSRLCRRGRNRLRMQSRQPAFSSLSPSLHSLEPVALYGSFALRDRVVTRPADGSGPGGDWAERGYRYFSGAMTLRARFPLPAEYLDYDLWLELGEVRECASVRLNGEDAGVRVHPPFNFDITDLVRAGENLLECRVRNSAANLLGRPQPSGILSAIRVAAFAPEG